MARLIHCWFIIESIVIPDGFLKWFYLSFYIRPLLLLFCQIFLWLKQLKIWTLRLFLLFVLKPTNFVVSCMLHLLRFFRVPCTTSSSYYPNPSPTSSNSEIVDTKKSNFQQNQIFSGSCSSFRFEFPRYESKIYEFDDDPGSSKTVNPETDSHRELTTARSDNDERGDLNSHADHEGANKVSKSCDEYPSSSSLCSSCSTVGRENDLQDKAEDHYCSFVEFLQFPSAIEENKDDASNEIPPDDPFFNLYLQRMTWFDLLGYERTCGETAILKSELGFRNTFEGMETSKSSPHKPLSKLSKQKILKSIENDVEMVYVAQSWLSWDALYHQYVKVQDFISSSSSNTFTFLPNNTADAFQMFQILLEKFMEDDQSCKQGTRYSNYVHRRKFQKSLLQVPQVAADEKMQDKKGEDKDMQLQARKVLKAIENCIKTFWDFVNTDNKKFWYKFKTSRSTYARVEDPRDLPLLADVTMKLQKHELRIKDLQGKKRCRLKMKRMTSRTGEAKERNDILFALIDLGLVKRALKMSVISSSQLRWCQQKLDNIHYKDGKVSRTITNNSPLFPLS